jgi:hypothetical protein
MLNHHVVYETSARKKSPRYKVEFLSEYGFGWIDIANRRTKLSAILDAKFGHWATGNPYRVVDTNRASD